MALDGSAATQVSATATPYPTSVRLAGPEDEIRVFNFLKLLHSENGMSALDPASALEMIRKGTLKQGGLIGIVEEDGEIVASIGLLVNKLWYSADAYFLDEQWMFVHPDHRVSHHFDALVQFAKWAAESMKMPVSVGLFTLGRLSAKTRLYRRHFNQLGAIFIYSPEVA